MQSKRQSKRRSIAVAALMCFTGEVCADADMFRIIEQFEREEIENPNPPCEPLVYRPVDPCCVVRQMGNMPCAAMAEALRDGPVMHGRPIVNREQY